MWTADSSSSQNLVLTYRSQKPRHAAHEFRPGGGALNIFGGTGMPFHAFRPLPKHKLSVL